MAQSGTISRAPRPSSLADVLDLILDKGLVIDAYVRVSVVGIELLTVDARVVVASVDTYLRFAEAVNRLDLTQTETGGLPELFSDEGSKPGDRNGERPGRGNDRGRDQKELSAGGSGRAGAGDGERSGDEADQGGIVARMMSRGRVS